MAKLLNRVKYTTSTSGTGTLSLSTTAETGFQTFPDAGVHIRESDYRYVIENGSNFEIGTGTYSESSAVASYDPDTQVGSNDPRSITFKPDGSKMYLGTATDVYQYALSTNWDITSATYENKALGSGAYGIAFNNDGTKFYRGSGSYSAGNWYTHTLSTAYDISTSTGSTDAGTWSSSYSYAHDLAWNNDGTKFFLLRYRSLSGNNYPILYEFSASTAYDASDSSLTQLDSKDENALASYYPHDDLVWSPGQQIVSFSFNSDGTQLYLLEKFRKSVIRLNLSTGFDLSTASFHSVTVDRSDFTSSWGLYFKDNDEIFIFGEDASNSSMVTKHDKANAVPTLTRTLTDSTTGSLINLSGNSTVFVGASAEDYLSVSNISLGDSDVLNFGNDNDLQIYGSGAGSYVSSTPSLRLKSTSEAIIYVGGFATADKRARFSSDGDAELFYSGSEKLATTDTGVTVTGTLTADALSGNIVFEGSTADDFETTLTVVDPTADRTVTFADQTGKVVLWDQYWPDDPQYSSTANYQNYVLGAANFPNITSSHIRNVILGHNNILNGSNTSIDDNVIVGINCCDDLDNSRNVVMGAYAGRDIKGARNVAIGANAMTGNTSGNGNSYNVAIGDGCHFWTGTGDQNIMMGYNTNTYYSGGSFNVGLGSQVRTSNNYNVSVGYRAGNSPSTSNNYNTFVGSEAGFDSDAGDNCTFVGRQAGYGGGNGDYNTAIGESSQRQLNGGSANSSCGRQSLYNITTGSQNSALGHAAGYNLNTGSNNTFLGYQAGYYNGSSTGNATTTGENVTVIGYRATASSSSASNEITLGNSSISSLRCNVQTISSLSDERDKTAIEDLSLGLDFINDMRPVEFTWNRRDGSYGAKLDLGFIAQDLFDVEIDHGSQRRTRLVNTDNPEKLEADYVRSYPILVKAVQELSAKVDALTARVAELEGE